MSKASDHRTPEERTYLKQRFDFLRKRTKGRSQHPALGSPLNGKNRAQRQRVTSGFTQSQVEYDPFAPRIHQKSSAR